ncbi:hypothetical protein [Butyrivibrio sp. M55]|uniref:hypothetical protein n=1 Tax=Butyrivibrio sp. M55 TaxID=1855323 RepID=UPI0008F1838F|nr:hypothetical protein [Butyrivibrio sp. M55]SFU88974.1 hypothetical protein SAMN05216540_11752 [Butyrivibrio sp. M55]
MSEYNAKNYTEQGGEVTHIGGKIVYDNGLMPNMSTADVTSDTVAKVRTSLNALITKLKNAGLMVADAFTMQYAAVTDSVSGHADRTYNTGKISSVSVDNEDHIITITLSDKVKNLKDFDGGNGWGVHKWLGIGLGVGISPITDLYYNGTALSSADVSEATACDLSAGYFVRWVAADLVLAGDNTQKSVDNFTLWADGYAETVYKLVIVEPE